MKEYDDEKALALQRKAFNGDDKSCWLLMEWCEKEVKRMVKASTIPKPYHSDVFHDFVVLATQRIATGVPVPTWRSWAYTEARNIIRRHVRREVNRINREKRYMNERAFRFNSAYPILRGCVKALPPIEQDLIQRMYFRPVRQNLLEYSLEMCQNYYAVKRLHKRTLNALRVMLAHMGVFHA